MASRVLAVGDLNAYRAPIRGRMDARPQHGRIGKHPHPCRAIVALTRDSAILPPVTPAWRLLPLILAVAFAARVGVVVGGDFIYHPDVVFQYLEPAWRLLSGDGLVVWEQFYGARSQLIPAFLALVMMVLQALGFDHPTTLRTALELVLCAVSLLIPWGMYAFARTLFDEHTGRVALILGAAWYELVALAGQPLSETLALSPVLWAFALATDVRSASRARTLGFLVVAVCALRFQYGPVALWIAVLAWPRMVRPWRRHFLVALAASLVFVGLFDLMTVGAPPYRSYIANIAFNVVFAGKALELGLDLPWYFHPVALALQSGGLAVAAFTAGLLHDRHGTPTKCALWLLVPIALMLVTHASSPWKEYRHVLVAVPLWLVLLATTIGVLWHRSNTRAQILVKLVGAWFVASSVLGMLSKLPLQGASHPGPPRIVPLHLIGHRDPRLSFATSLANDHKLVGLAEIGVGLAGGIGFFHLGRVVPVYDAYAIEALYRCDLSTQDYASHAIVPSGSPLPSGFVVTQKGEYGWRLAERTGHEARPARPTTLDPVWVDGLFGDAARALFEGDSETDSWIGIGWHDWIEVEDGFFPLGRFRVHGPGSRKAPESRLELPSNCRISVARRSDGRDR